MEAMEAMRMTLQARMATWAGEVQGSHPEMMDRMGLMAPNSSACLERVWCT